MTRRSKLVRPEVIRAESDSIITVCREVAALARLVAETYDELHDQAYSETRIGESAGGNGRGKPIGDPTGDVVASGLHERLRRQVRRSAGKVRKLRPILEEAETLIMDGFLELDPEMAQRLRELREKQQAALAGEGSG